MNRYEEGQTVEMPHRCGSVTRVVLRKPPRIGNRPTVLYTTTAADLIWTIADVQYGDAADWWVLADMNPHVTCPDDLTYGMLLNIPAG